MHSMKNLSLNSLSPAGSGKPKVVLNLELVLERMRKFSRTDGDIIRANSSFFPMAKSGLSKNVFLSNFNHKYQTNISPSELDEMLVALGQNPNGPIHPHAFFQGVLKSETLDAPNFFSVREEQMKNASEMIRKFRPAAYQHSYDNLLQVERASSAPVIQTVSDLREVITASCRKMTKRDNDLTRNVMNKLQIQNASGHGRNMTSTEVKKVLYQSFLVALSDDDVARLFADYITPQGRIDLRSFMENILGEVKPMVIAFAKNSESAERARIVDKQNQFFEQLEKNNSIWTVEDARRLLNYKIDQFSSKESDRYRQVFQKFGNTTHVTKEKFIQGLRVNFQMHMSDQLLDELFQTIDDNGDGLLELCELVAFLKKEQVRRPSPRNLGKPFGPEAESGIPFELRRQRSFGRKDHFTPGKSRGRLGGGVEESRSGAATSMSRLISAQYDPSAFNRNLMSAGAPRLITSPPPPGTADAQGLLERYQLAKARAGRRTNQVPSRAGGGPMPELPEGAEGQKIPSPPPGRGTPYGPPGGLGPEDSLDQLPRAAAAAAAAGGGRAQTPPEDEAVDQLMDLLGAPAYGGLNSLNASPITSRANSRAAAARGGGGAGLAGRASGLSQMGRVSLSPTRPTTTGLTSRLMSRVSSSKHMARDPNIAKLSMGLSATGSRKALSPKTSFIKSKEMTGVVC